MIWNGVDGGDRLVGCVAHGGGEFCDSTSDLGPSGGGSELELSST
jgi:hypothetical protein